MRVSELPIPKDLSSLLEARGYSNLYPPQEEAYRAGALEGRSMVLTSPTASGKTLVAILAAGKTILEGGGKVVYLTPLRALANEKYEEFKVFESLRKADGSDVSVMISTGDYDSPGGSLQRGDIAILTNERFDSLLRHGAPWLDRVQLFVSDEVHLVGDLERGPTLESVLTKILALDHHPQILALSATVTNSEDLAKWLKAELVDLSWRPVQLLEGIYEYGEIRFSDGSRRMVQPTNRGPPIDLAVDALRDGGQSLIFAETRKRAVGLAIKASELTPRFLSSSEAAELREISEGILETGEETELSRNLSEVVAKGAAFHHAGLLPQHRRIVEEGFRKRLIKILTSTPTLAAGVNLPARRVIISSLMRYDSEYGGQSPISVLDYKQMCGRAGRPQFDQIGETVIITSSSFDGEEVYHQYIEGQPEPIRSKLVDEGALRTHLLATIVSLPGISTSEIKDLFSRSLLAVQYRPTIFSNKFSRAIDYLVDEGLIKRRGKRFLATDFGRRVSTLYIDPATGVNFRMALRSVKEEGPHLAGILHLIVSTPDFYPKFSLRSKDWNEAISFLEEHREELIIPMPRKGDLGMYDGPLQDFRSLLILYSWMKEWSGDRLLDKFGVEPGDLHRAVENSDWLLYSLSEISKLMGRADLLPEIDQARQRIRYGIRPELLPLVKLEGVGRVRARALYNAGYTNLSRIATASIEKLSRVPKIGTAMAKRIKEQLK